MERPKLMLPYMSNIIDSLKGWKKMTSRKSKFEFLTIHGDILFMKWYFLWQILVLPMSEYLFEQKNIDKVPNAGDWRPPEPPRSKSSILGRYRVVI